MDDVPERGIEWLGVVEQAPSTELSLETVGLLSILAGKSPTGVSPHFHTPHRCSKCGEGRYVERGV